MIKVKFPAEVILMFPTDAACNREELTNLITLGVESHINTSNVIITLKNFMGIEEVQVGFRLHIKDPGPIQREEVLDKRGVGSYTYKKPVPGE